MEGRCYSCEQNRLSGPLAPRDAILVEGGWRAAHAFGTTLPGWPVLLPLRHVEGLQELTLDEAAALGPLLRRLSAALAEVTGCHKAYVIFLAEQPSFEHVHFHIVPRLPSFSKEESGAGVFAFMRRPKAEQVSERGRDAMALGIRRALASA